MSTNQAPAARSRRWLAWAAALGLAGVAVGPTACAQREAAAAGFEVVAVYPHDSNAFTQGLAIEAGTLYEGTGQYGASTVPS